MTETPVVIVDVQRVGPATGMPTKHEQGDLYHAVYGSHGEIPRAVLAPISVEDSFYMSVEAFNLAEKYQMPVIMLTDAAMSLRAEAFPTPDLSKLNIVNRLIYNSEERAKVYKTWKIFKVCSFYRRWYHTYGYTRGPKRHTRYNRS